MLTSSEAAEIHTTPNAVMRRYPGSEVAVWVTEMSPGASGPLHTIDREQVIIVLDGELGIEIDGASSAASRGDSVAVSAGAARQVRNLGESMLVTITAAVPGSLARVDQGEEVQVPWAR